MENDIILDTNSQEKLLENIENVFTEEDNLSMLVVPDAEEIRKVLTKANHNTAPGNDELTSYLYHLHFDILGTALTEVVSAVFVDKEPTRSHGLFKQTEEIFF